MSDESHKAAIDRVLRIVDEEVGLPYMARSRDYGPPEPPWTDEQKAALKAADEEADRKNREFAARIVAAVLGGRE